ncbi:MAG: type II toxin-antitoxin system VapC family toxin [Usitatibacter sp.]
MIILDTNVVSELMRASPDESVLRWVAAQSSAVLHITSLTQAEILHGVLLLPAGKKRAAIQAAADAMFATEFSGRILPFASAAAAGYAGIAADRRRAGRPISQFDAQIAAIARVERARIATRNVSDFEGCGVKVIDPWNQ